MLKYTSLLLGFLFFEGIKPTGYALRMAFENAQEYRKEKCGFSMRPGYDLVNNDTHPHVFIKEPACQK